MIGKFKTLRRISKNNYQRIPQTKASDSSGAFSFGAFAMNELIPILFADVGGEQIQTCNARELHSFLDVGKDFSTWIKDRIKKYDFIEGVDFAKIDSPVSGNQRGGDRR